MGELSGINVLQRWVERAGRMELLELPLTPELFLDPQLGDKILQGSRHFQAVFSLYELISRHLSSEPDTYVFSDLKHLIGPGLGPAPDISVVRGLAPDRDFESYDLRSEIPPFFVTEVVSPSDARIRRTDEVDKVKVYEKVGIQEYLLVYLSRANGHRFQLKGYRLGPDRRYLPMQPDSQGRAVSETIGLAFGVSPDGGRIYVFNLETGERLLNAVEQQEAMKAAEERAARAEEELERLRAEIERLKG
ncbi:MAG TPA: Uma2 family endonuclease [Thermoanaerobaculia bacterium]|nr:Uma2 family endonuclease [Thermoanaerobaculia bacterium]